MTLGIYAHALPAMKQDAAVATDDTSPRCWPGATSPNVVPRDRANRNTPMLSNALMLRA